MWRFVVFVCFASFVAAELSSAAKDARIVSGWEASEGQFPYTIYVRGINSAGQITGCGGSIIHARWGLTSARCVATRVSLIISGGMVNIHRPRFVIETSVYATAPDFILSMWQLSQPNDLALVGFNTDLVFDSFVQPIRLQRSADARKDYTGELMTVSGWGTTYTPGLYEIYEMSETLHWGRLAGVNNFVCLLMINSNWLVQETTICAGPHSGNGQGICSGDSGVPLVTTDVDGNPTQVGVGSFVSSFGCDAGFPNGFVRPGFYLDWMRQVTGVDLDW